nr:transposase [Noviherbaspirillum cavernae]
MKLRALVMAQDQGFDQCRKPTRRDQFLETMDRIVPWTALCAVVEPHYPNAGNGPAANRSGTHAAHSLSAALVQLGRILQDSGMTLKTGTIVDATIIAAPSSTKNADKERDPEMHQTRKGQQWYFGMKLHIGVDSQSGLAHSAVVTAANVHDKHPLRSCCMDGRSVCMATMPMRARRC